MTSDDSNNDTPTDDDLQEVRAAWLNSESDESPTPNKKDGAMLIHELHQLKSKQAATVRNRDLVESAAAVLVIILFGQNALFSEDINLRIGCGICVAGAMLVMVMLWWGRRKFVEADMAVTPREACQRQLEAVQQQQRMLRSVPIWYIAPIAFGVLWIAVSMMGGWFLYGYLSVCAVFFVWVAWINRRAANKHFQPEIDKLSDLLRELEE